MEPTQNDNAAAGTLSEMRAERTEPLPLPFTFPRCGGHFNVSTVFGPRSTLLATAAIERGKVVILGLTSDVPIPVAEFQSFPLALSFDESGDYLSVLESDRITTWNISDVEHLSQQSMMELDAELVGGYAWAEMIESNQFPWNLRPFPLASPVSLSDVTRIFKSKFIGERTLWSTRSARVRQLMITYDENAENNAMPTVSVVDQITLEVLRSISFSEWKNVVVSSDGSLMAAALPQDTSTEIWDLHKGTIVAKVDCPQMHKSQFSSDNRYLLSVVPDLSGYANLKFIDLLVNRESHIFLDIPFWSLFGCAENSDRIAVIANDVRHPVDVSVFLDLPFNGTIWRAAGHPTVSFKLFSPDGAWFASISNAAAEESSVDAVAGGALRLTNLSTLGNEHASAAGA